VCTVHVSASSIHFISDYQHAHSVNIHPAHSGTFFFGKIDNHPIVRALYLTPSGHMSLQVVSAGIRRLCGELRLPSLTLQVFYSMLTRYFSFIA